MTDANDTPDTDQQDVADEAMDDVDPTELDSDASDDSSDSDDSDDSDDDASDASSDSDDDEDDSSDSSDDDDDEDGAPKDESSGGSRSSRRRRGRRGRGGRGKGGSSNGSKDDSSKGGSEGDQAELEKQMAKGGTRTASRKGGGSRGGRGGGGRRSGRNQSSIPEEVRQAMLAGPPKTMLVSHRSDRTQIVVMEERNAVEHYMHKADDVTYVGNVYMARVQNVLPGMEAAFLDIGKGRNGVLYAGEVNYDELDVEDGGTGVRIEDALSPGQAVLVQVTKDPMGTKGPRLTMEISLAGRYMVLSPNSDVFGISRKLTDKERDRLRRLVKGVKPKHHGVIVRTAAAEADDEAIQADLERLIAKWESIEERAKEAKALTPVYEEPPLVVKVIRDNFGADFDRLVVDDQGLHDQVREYLEEVAPDLLEKVHLWQPPKDGEKKLLAAYEVSEQLRKATERKVWLPSGGYLIIETTEAMKVIDVNTGKFTGKKGSNLEDVVFKTNIEAAKEIVRQLRLRDMGGIIIIDFIDMLLKANQDEVIRTLERELLRDRTKTRVSDVSRLGLVQMTRKNVSAGLVESFSSSCDHCHGRGFNVKLD
jgi:ribonuclease E